MSRGVMLGDELELELRLLAALLATLLVSTSSGAQMTHVGELCPMARSNSLFARTINVIKVTNCVIEVVPISKYLYYFCIQSLR